MSQFFFLIIVMIGYDWCSKSIRIGFVLLLFYSCFGSGHQPHIRDRWLLEYRGIDFQVGAQVRPVEVWFPSMKRLLEVVAPPQASGN